MSAGPIAPREAQTNALDAFLVEVRASQTTSRGRLIFGLDATASRRPAWDLAASLQSQMFKEAGKIGNLDLHLVFYRGDKESGKPQAGSRGFPTRLARIMSTIDCRAGVRPGFAIPLAHVEKETALLHVGAPWFSSGTRWKRAPIFLSPERVN